MDRLNESLLLSGILKQKGLPAFANARKINHSKIKSIKAKLINTKKQNERKKYEKQNQWRKKQAINILKW